ncbi:MAG: glucosamine-6-phosphate deaminase [Ruminococcaceae bacterium]|nr:glucosamine-6-phosphate deaminase [Oscillospiraceae bacterium]
MNIIVCKNYEEMSLRSARIVAEQIRGKPNFVLGLATGSTPEGMYAQLADMNKKGELTFKDVTTVNLDEYYPISPSNEQSYRYFMNDRLFDRIDIDKANTHVPDGTASDPVAEGKRYEELITELGGIDLQVLGIGRNGHIGFNEPDSKLILDTHITDLTESTIEANSRFFASPSDVPRRALTMGIGSIFKAKKILLLISGVEKKNAVSALLERTVDTGFPATMLNLHPDVTLVCTADVLD